MTTKDHEHAASPDSAASPSLDERKIYAMNCLMEAESLSDADDFKAALAAYRKGMSEQGLPLQTLMSDYLNSLYAYVQNSFDIDVIDEFCEFINSRADDIIRYCGPFCIYNICDRIIEFKIQTKAKVFHDKLYAHCESIYKYYSDRNWKSNPERKNEKGLILEHIKLLHLDIVLERTTGDAIDTSDESSKSNPQESISLKRLRDYATLYKIYYKWKNYEEERTDRRVDNSRYEGIGKWCEPAVEILKGLKKAKFEDRLFSAFLYMCEKRIIKAQAGGDAADQKYRRATGLCRELLDACGRDDNRLGVNETDKNAVRRNIIKCIYNRLELLNDKDSEKAAEFAEGIIRESKTINFDEKVNRSDVQIKDISEYLFKAANLCKDHKVSNNLYKECLRVLNLRDSDKYTGNDVTQAKLLYRKAMCLRAIGGNGAECKRCADAAVEMINKVKDNGKEDIKNTKREIQELQSLVSGSDNEVMELLGEIADNPKMAVKFHLNAMALKGRYPGKGEFVMGADTMEDVVRIYLEHFDRKRFDELIDGMDERNVPGLNVILYNARRDFETIKRIPYSRDILLSNNSFIRKTNNDYGKTNKDYLLKLLENFEKDVDSRENFIGMLRAGWNYGTPERMDSLLAKMLGDREKNHILDMSQKKLGELLEILAKSFDKDSQVFSSYHLDVVRDALAKKEDAYLGKADMILADMYLEAGEPLKALEAVNRAIDARPYLRYRMKRNVILDEIGDENVTQIYNRGEFLGNIYDDEEEDEVYDETTVEQFFLTFSLLDWQKYGNNRLLNKRIDLKGSTELKKSFAKAKAKAEERNRERQDKIIREESARKLFLQWIPEIDDDLIGRRISKFYEKRRNSDGSADNRLYRLCEGMVELLDSNDLDDNLVRGFTDIVIRTLEKGIPPKEVNDKTVCRIKYVLAFCYHRIGMPESASKHIKDIKDIITSRTKDNYIISDLATTKLDELSKLISKEAESSEPTAVSKDHKNNPFAYHDVFSKFNRDSVLKYIYHDWTMDGSKITGYNKSRQEFFEEVVNKAENLKNNTLFRGSFVNMLTDYIDGSEGWIDWRGVRHNRTLRYFREKEKESFVLRQNANNGLSPESLRDSVRVTSADNLRELFEYAREQAVKEYFTNGDHQAAQCIIFDYNIGNAVDFYCDKRTLSDALTRIFKDMLQLYMQLYKGKELTIEIEHRKEKSPDGGSSYVVTLTQRNATTSRTCKEFCDKLSNGGGNFSDVRNILRNVCDWSVETIWTDGPRRVNCLSAYEDLTVDASEDLASLTNDQNKFRHIFRIYNT